VQALVVRVVKRVLRQQLGHDGDAARGARRHDDDGGAGGGGRGGWRCCFCCCRRVVCAAAVLPRRPRWTYSCGSIRVSNPRCSRRRRCRLLRRLLRRRRAPPHVHVRGVVPHLGADLEALLDAEAAALEQSRGEAVAVGGGVVKSEG
jgi:hypothetical protein